MEQTDLERIKYLIKKAMKYNLKAPEQVIVYLSQQGFEDITPQEVADLMKEMMLGD